MPASSQAWIKVMPAGTSCSLPSMMSLGMRLRSFAQDGLQEGAELWRVRLKVTGFQKVGREQISAVQLELEADRCVPFPGRRDLQNLLAGIEDDVHEQLVFLKHLG